jgi:cytochrome c553
MNSPRFTSPLALLALVWAGQIYAGSLPEIAPHYFVANCANCHGTDGKTNSAIPPLAGRDKVYLEETLKAYKTGDKAGTIMPQLTKGYTDEEIAILADYFSKQK